MDFKEAFKKYKKKIVVAITAAALTAIGYLALDVKPNPDAVLKGDLSTIGQSIEDAPE